MLRFISATGLRFALGIPFIFLSVTAAFLSISGGLGVISVVMFIGTYFLSKYASSQLCRVSSTHKLCRLAVNKLNRDEEDEKRDRKKEKSAADSDDSEDEDNDKKNKKNKKKGKKSKINRESSEELHQLVDIPKDSGVLIVFEGMRFGFMLLVSIASLPL